MSLAHVYVIGLNMCALHDWLTEYTCKQWRRSVVKYGVRVSQVKPSNYVSDFQTLNNSGSRQPVGASKIRHKSVILDDVKLAELSNDSFE